MYYKLTQQQLNMAIEIRGMSFGELFGPEAFSSYPSGLEAATVDFRSSRDIAVNENPWFIPLCYEVLLGYHGGDTKSRKVTREEWYKQYRAFRVYQRGPRSAEELSINP